MLEECGLPYDLKKVEIGKDSVKPPLLLSVNPEGTIPTLVDPDGPGEQPVYLRQSTAILFYMANKTGKLLPKTSSQQPGMLEWTMFAVTDVVGANTAMYQTEVVREFVHDGGAHAATRRHTVTMAVSTPR